MVKAPISYGLPKFRVVIFGIGGGQKKLAENEDIQGKLLVSFM